MFWLLISIFSLPPSLWLTEDWLAGSVYIVVYTSVMLEMQGWEFVSLLFSASFLLISLIFPRRHLSSSPPPHIPTCPLAPDIWQEAGALTIFALLFSCFSCFSSEILAGWRSVSLKSSPEIWALLALLSCIRVFQSPPICRVFCLSQNRSMAVQGNWGPGWTQPPPPPPPVSHDKIFKFTAQITRYNPLPSDITVSKGSQRFSAWPRKGSDLLKPWRPRTPGNMFAYGSQWRRGGETTDFPATTN